MSEEIVLAPVVLRKSGDIEQEIDGLQVKVATYSRKTGHLEYASQEYANKLSSAISQAIGTINKGQDSSGLTIKSVGIAGRKVDKLSAKEPPCPKRDPRFGDTTPAVVKWYMKWRPQEFIVRYGVFVDENGEMILRRVKRKTTETYDDRDGSLGLADEKVYTGEKTFEKAPVGQRTTLEFFDDQIVARRATCITFSPNEVVGGFDTGEESGQADGNEGGALADTEAGA